MIKYKFINNCEGGKRYEERKCGRPCQVNPLDDNLSKTSFFLLSICQVSRKICRSQNLQRLSRAESEHQAGKQRKERGKEGGKEKILKNEIK